MAGSNSRLQKYIGYRVRVTMHEDRVLVGVLMAYDKHMNVVLSDTTEFRKSKGKDQEEKRTLGMLMLRGENVIALSAEAPAKED